MRTKYAWKKLEYSPLGKVFNKGLDEDDKKEGLLKRISNIEDKKVDKDDRAAKSI